MEIKTWAAPTTSRHACPAAGHLSRYLGGDDTYQFPAPWDSHVRHLHSGCFRAYRAHAAFSTSACGGQSLHASSRVIEVLACGTPVVSTRCWPPTACCRRRPAIADRAQAGHTRASARDQPGPRGVHASGAWRSGAGTPVTAWRHRCAASRRYWGGPRRSHHRTAGVHASGPGADRHVLETPAGSGDVMAPVISPMASPGPGPQQGLARELGLRRPSAPRPALPWGLLSMPRGSSKPTTSPRWTTTTLRRSLPFESPAADYACAVRSCGASTPPLPAPDRPGPDGAALRRLGRPLYDFVPGPTLVASERPGARGDFSETTTGEDTGFSDCARAGARISIRPVRPSNGGTTFGHNLGHSTWRCATTISH